VLFTTASSMPGVLDTRVTTPSAVATDAVVPLLDDEGDANSMVRTVGRFFQAHLQKIFYICNAAILF
jgi:hypothetical protein